MSIRIIPARRVRKVKTKNGQEVLQRLEVYLESKCEDPVEILCGFWKDQQDAITYQELRQAVIDGTLTTETLELWRQDYSILVADRLNNVWTKAIEAGPKGQPILDGLAFEFNTQTPGIFDWLKERGANFVTECTQEQRDAIAALLTKTMRESHTVDELARLIRPCIGLTEGQTKANARYYDSIVANLRKEHPRMKIESIRKKARDAALKYAERQHRERALTIAQTESAFAYNRGADEGVRQAQEKKLLGKCKKRWSTSGDDGVCTLCASLEGTEVDMDSDFNISGRLLFNGQHMLPPSHPKCACAVEYIEISPPTQSEVDMIGIEGNADYLLRDHAPGIDTSEERVVIDNAISSVPEKVRETLNKGTVIDVGKTGACQYDYANDILYIAKGADKTSVIHEIGHMVENKMLNASKVMDALVDLVGEVDIMQINIEKYYDVADNPVEIMFIRRPTFVSDYQGRIYSDTIWDAFDDNGNFRYELLMEFVSEAFREYVENPGNLLVKNRELFLLLSEVMV